MAGGRQGPRRRRELLPEAEHLRSQAWCPVQDGVNASLASRLAAEGVHNPSRKSTGLFARGSSH
jgi:hypothetical protein